MIELKKIKKQAKMPFRLDLVMGGVSDLDFWSSMKGDCLSLACDVYGKSIQMEGVLIKDAQIYLDGFWQGGILCYSQEDVEKIIISEINPSIQMAIAALRVAFKVLRNGGGDIEGGFYIKNNSVRQKGMGGSSVFATVLISLLCKLYDVSLPTINDMIAYVMEAERLCESNGGWEDVAGSYYAGINRVKYRPTKEDKLIVEVPDVDEACFDTLHNCLLLIDSGINTSTGEILNAAYNTFQNKRKRVVVSTEIIRDECDKVVDAIKLKDMEYFGKSLAIQRKQWGIITDGMSLCKQVDVMLKPLSQIIYGYREAGAGGGGTVLIVCKEGKKQEVSERLSSNGIASLYWDVSKYGLEVY